MRGREQWRRSMPGDRFVCGVLVTSLTLLLTACQELPERLESEPQVSESQEDPDRDVDEGDLTGIASPELLPALPPRVSLDPPEKLSATPEGVFTSDDTMLSWSPVSGALGYELEIYDEADGTEPVFALGDSELGATALSASPTLSEPGSYRFRVRAVHGANRGAWSESSRFDISARVKILTPKNGQRLSSRRPFFQWEARSPDSKRFEIEIVRENSQRPLVRRVVDRSQFQLYEPLARGRSYRVRVRPDGHRSTKAWSDPVKFDILATRADPFPIIPITRGTEERRSRATVSVDGQLMALVSRKVGEPGTSAIEILERGAGTASFRPYPGSASRFPGLERLEAPLPFFAGTAREPVLLVASGSCTVNIARPGSGGKIHRIDNWSSGTAAMISAPGGAPIVAVSTNLSGPPERIVFETRRLAACVGSSDRASLVGEIWSARADGSDLRLHVVGRSPALSPDGKRLAYVADGPAGAEIRLLGLPWDRATPETVEVEAIPASGEIRIPSPAVGVRGIEGLAWSPRSTHLVYARDVGEGHDIVLRELHAGKEILVTREFSDDIDPTFFPDALSPHGFSGIVFASDRIDSAWNLYFADLATLDD